MYAILQMLHSVPPFTTCILICCTYTHKFYGDEYRELCINYVEHIIDIAVSNVRIVYWSLYNINAVHCKLL